MNRKSVHARARIIQLLVEGNSLRAVSRIADCSINTVTKLLVEIGTACATYQDKAFNNLPCTTLQVDEIYSFVYAREKNVPEGKKDAGTVWTWVAICADTKLVPCWTVGSRDSQTAHRFIYNLCPRMKNRIQLTSDGFKSYKEAVDNAYGKNIDYAMLVKMYDESGKKRQKYIGATKDTMIGNPDPAKISTSFVERQNLTMRMNIKRFARKTNAHSKKLFNHECAIALHFMYYNFCRIHKSLRITPAMAAGITDRLWDIEDLVYLIKNPIKKPTSAPDRATAA